MSTAAATATATAMAMAMAMAAAMATAMATATATAKQTPPPLPLPPQPPPATTPTAAATSTAATVNVVSTSPLFKNLSPYPPQDSQNPGCFKKSRTLGYPSLRGQVLIFYVGWKRFRCGLACCENTGTKNLI